MATKKTQKKKDKQQSKIDNDLDKINVFWTVLPGWNEASYETKLKHYWEFKIENGVRVIDLSPEVKDNA